MDAKVMNTYAASSRLIVNSFHYSHRATWTAAELIKLMNNTTTYLVIDCELFLLEPCARKAHENDEAHEH